MHICNYNPEIDTIKDLLLQMVSSLIIIWANPTGNAVIQSVIEYTWLKGSFGVLGMDWYGSELCKLNVKWEADN